MLSAIQDDAISDQLYTGERQERRADTQAAGVAALIAIAQEPGRPEPVPAPAPEPARPAGNAAGAVPAATATSAGPVRRAASATSADAAARAASATSAGPGRRAATATSAGPVARAASAIRPRRWLAGREGKHRRAGTAHDAGPHEPCHAATADSHPGPRPAWPGSAPGRAYSAPGPGGPVPGRPGGSHEAPCPEFGTVFQPVVDLVSGVIVGYQALVSIAGGWTPHGRAAKPVTAGADVAMEGALTRAAMSVAPVLPGRCWLAAEVSMRLLAADPVLVNGIGALARPVVLVLQQPAVADLDASLWWLLGRLPANVSLAIGDVRPDRDSLNVIARLRPAYLRIERDAVVRLEYDRARQRRIAALVADAQKYGSKVIAAGIETPQERDVLCRLGVHGGVYAGV